MLQLHSSTGLSTANIHNDIKAWNWILESKSRSTPAVARHPLYTKRHSLTSCSVRRQSSRTRFNSTTKHFDAALTAYALPGSSISFSSRSKREQTSNLLPDPVLFKSIKACGSLFDCQQLLSRKTQQLDAMLLSTLVSQTVLVSVDVQQNEQQELLHHQQRRRISAQENSLSEAAEQAIVPAALAAGLQKEAAASTVDSSSSGGSNRRASVPAAVQHVASSSRPLHTSRSAGQAFSRYLRQLSDVALQLCGSFRPQQFANVLWGLAKCGYKAPPAWIKSYLTQAELQLVRFSPRNLAQLVWALGTMQSEVPRQFCASFLAECSDKLTGFKPIDLANTLWGLAALAGQPPRDWLATALAACERQWMQFKPQELSIAVWGLAKLGMGFRAQPGHQYYGVAGGLDDAGVHRLLGVITCQIPVMTPQQASNLMWGLAAGQAPLSPQQVQVLAEQSLLVLRQSASSCCSQALATIAWSLVKLHWTPSHHQAQQLLSLLLQHQHQHALTARQAALLLWCCSKLRIRPPVAAMQQLMAQLTTVLPTAAPADAVQVLVGCRTLGWRQSRIWWSGFYARSLVLVEQATVGELAQLLAAAAAVVPLRPTKPWWSSMWRQVGTAGDATFEARHIQRRGQLAIAARKSTCSQQLGRSNSNSSSDGSQLVVSRACSRRDVGSSSSMAACNSSRRKMSARSAAAEQELLQLNPYAVLQQYMQRYISLRAAAKALPRNTELQHVLLNHHSAMLLLWACAKLKMLMPKKVLWQLLLLVLLDLPCYSPEQLSKVMHSIGVLLETHGHDKVQCHTVLKYLTVAAQWRLHTGHAGEGAVHQRYSRALRFMAFEANASPLLVTNWQGQGA